MKTISNIEKRLDSLEKSENKDRTFIFVEYEGTALEETTGYIIEHCRAACDKETYEAALDTAFVAIQGKNPLQNEDSNSIIAITPEIAVKTVENLRAAGIEVDVNLDGIAGS